MLMDMDVDLVLALLPMQVQRKLTGMGGWICIGFCTRLARRLSLFLLFRRLSGELAPLASRSEKMEVHWRAGVSLEFCKPRDAESVRT